MGARETKLDVRHRAGENRVARARRKKKRDPGRVRVCVWVAFLFKEKRKSRRTGCVVVSSSLLSGRIRARRSPPPPHMRAREKTLLFALLFTNKSKIAVAPASTPTIKGPRNSLLVRARGSTHTKHAFLCVCVSVCLFSFRKLNLYGHSGILPLPRNPVRPLVRAEEKVRGDHNESADQPSFSPFHPFTV